MTFGSLFAGIGGFDLGLERAGMTCKWQVEIDDYATRVLEKHWPDVRRWRDVAEFIADAESEQGACRVRKNGRAWERKSGGVFGVDLICGGFPCQPVSVAGARRGDSDERWLWDSFREVVRIIRPRYVLAENVPGLLSASSGRLFGNILGDLARLGYSAEWGVLPAAAFGAPHLRKRVFIAAHPLRPECEPGDAADANAAGLQERQGEVAGGPGQNCRAQPVGGEWRSIKPTICRGDDGVPNRVDRLRCLGNAVVPHVAEWIGRRIMANS